MFLAEHILYTITERETCRLGPDSTLFIGFQVTHWIIVENKRAFKRRHMVQKSRFASSMFTYLGNMDFKASFSYESAYFVCNPLHPLHIVYYQHIDQI